MKIHMSYISNPFVQYSSFGHLDGLNATIRTGNQSFMLSDAHIRFERNTEMKPKSGELVEKVRQLDFIFNIIDYDLIALL